MGDLEAVVLLLRISRMALPRDEMKCVRADGVALHDETSEAQCQAQCDQIQVTYPHTNRG